MEKIKWQIHAETSLIQIMFWIILIKLFGGIIITCLGILYIIGNFSTLFKSLNRLRNL